jgi:diphosphomevalonate decarboxylase
MKCIAVAPSNIAFIKYWGKRDENLKLPLNSSISMTLDDNVSTTTTVEFSARFPADSFILNDIRQTGEKLSRVLAHLDRIRKLARIESNAHVKSTNSFPTGAGIASSASGFAALTLASAAALELKLSTKELTLLSRLGSGSSARSFHSGFVIWHAGNSPDGSDSFAEQIAPMEHWPELRDIIIISEKNQKKTGSTEGMRKCSNSRLMNKRLDQIGLKLEMVEAAIGSRDFNTLASLIMEDSDRMHAIMQDCGLVYLNDDSRRIIDFVKSFNHDRLKVAYTFDAGPNAHLITLKDYVPEISEYLEGMEMIISKPGTGARLL